MADELKFPRLVFCSPGPHSCQGGTYAYEIVESQEDFESAIEAGYSATVPEALANRGGKKDAEKVSP